MPDKNEVENGRLVRPIPLLPDKLGQRATAQEIRDFLDHPGTEGAAADERRFADIWRAMTKQRRAVWFKHFYHTDPVVNYLVHKMIRDARNAIDRVGPATNPDAEETDTYAEGALFSVQCQCGRTLVLPMVGLARTIWERQRVECPECHIIYEFERKAV